MPSALALHLLGRGFEEISPGCKALLGCTARASGAFGLIVCVHNAKFPRVGIQSMFSVSCHFRRTLLSSSEVELTDGPTQCCYFLYIRT